MKTPPMRPADGHLADLSGGAEDRLERIFEAFEAAWRDGLGPRIEDYLPAEPALRRAALFEMLYIDQEYAIRTGSSARVESYLARFPDFAADPDLPPELIAREYRHRLRRGETPTVGEYLGRFPSLADRLADRLRAESDGEPGPPEGTTVEDRPGGHDGSSLPGVTEAGPAYDEIRHHARGGMGDVYRARDIALAREVALKRVRPEYAGEARVRRRFLREARLTARLDHPGVVPIHGLIHDGDGQPWYVMRFVEGETLARAIEDYHRSSAARPDDRALAFRKLLARFVAVCDTIAFAHSRGVVHRDLKPSNVILGQYGETVVLDWGLATLADAGPDAPSPAPIAAVPAEDGDPPTFPGHALGTPPFMSPEQAEGSPTMNRPACDIYGLGAILYMILTGRPPFDPSAWPANLDEIIHGRFPAPRQVRPDAPRALEAACLKAMALRPVDRYRGAGDLARDVERWEADEPVSAWREPFAARVLRWTRRHRTAVTAASAAAMVWLVGLAVVLAVETRANRDLSAKNDELARSNTRSEDRFGLALEAIQSFRAGVTEGEMDEQKEVRGLRDRLLRSSAGFHERLKRTSPGSVRPQIGSDPRPVLLRAGRADRRDRDQARGADRAPRRRWPIRRGLAATPGDLAARGDLGLSLIAVGKLGLQTGDNAGALAAFEESRDVASALVAADPASPFYGNILASSHQDIAAVLADSGDPAGALRSYGEALKEFGRIVEAHPTLLKARNELSERPQRYRHPPRRPGRSGRCPPVTPRGPGDPRAGSSPPGPRTGFISRRWRGA